MTDSLNDLVKNVDDTYLDMILPLLQLHATQSLLADKAVIKDAQLKYQTPDGITHNTIFDATTYYRDYVLSKMVNAITDLRMYDFVTDLHTEIGKLKLINTKVN